MSSEIDQEFPKGLLRPELFMGVVSLINAQTIRINLNKAGNPSGAHFAGGRYGMGEVGEFVLIEGQQNICLGRIIEVRLPERERTTLNVDNASPHALDAIGLAQLLGSIGMDELRVTAGIETYPRLGDRVYAAPHKLVAKIPVLMDNNLREQDQILLSIGSVDVAQESEILINPEKLFGRHCAILGATGGGKSWTTARVIEECLKHKSKIILLDATSEYRGFSGNEIIHLHLGKPVEVAAVSMLCSLSPTSFEESDFVALFEPSGKVQGPKLRAAIRSLRLARFEPSLSTNGLIIKENKSKKGFNDAMIKHANKINDPREPIDVAKLPEQVVKECVQDYGEPIWKGPNEAEIGYCASLLTRINGVLTSVAFECVFGNLGQQLMPKIDEFVKGDNKLLRICLSGIAHEYNAREIIANVIGRYLLNKARKRDFLKNPVVLIVDEAHNFLGGHIGSEDYMSRLDAFEIIAKEGRKYGLNICLATQRPRDITEGVLSQMGTLIVHRLTNDRDREVVERACGEIDKSAAAFLPNLKPGEAAIIGADFPIPLTIQIDKPITKPKSDGPNYQKYWK